MLAAAILWPYSDHNGTFRIVCRHWLNPLFRLWVPQHCEEWDGLDQMAERSASAQCEYA